MKQLNSNQSLTHGLGLVMQIQLMKAEAKLLVSEVIQTLFSVSVFCYKFKSSSDSPSAFTFVALLKRQGINVKGLLKSTPAKEEPQPYIDCTGNLQVRINIFVS